MEVLSWAASWYGRCCCLQACVQFFTFGQLGCVGMGTSILLQSGGGRVPEVWANPQYPRQYPSCLLWLQTWISSQHITNSWLCFNVASSLWELPSTAIIHLTCLWRGSGMAYTASKACTRLWMLVLLACHTFLHTLGQTCRQSAPGCAFRVHITYRLKMFHGDGSGGDKSDNLLAHWTPEVKWLQSIELEVDFWMQVSYSCGSVVQSEMTMFKILAIKVIRAVGIDFIEILFEMLITIYAGQFNRKWLMWFATVVQF